MDDNTLVKQLNILESQTLVLTNMSTIGNFHNKLDQHLKVFFNRLKPFPLLYAGADVMKEGDTTGNRFRYPSYVQDIMG